MSESKPPVSFRDALQKALRRAGVQLALTSRNLEKLNDLDLLFQLEKTWDTLTNIKSFSNFLKHDLGIGAGRCVIVIAEKSEILSGIMESNLDSIANKHLITTAKTFQEGKALVDYYIGMKSLCVLIVDALLEGEKGNYLGVDLVRWTKNKASYSKTSVYCVVVDPASSSMALHPSLTVGIDLYIPGGYAPITLRNLVERQILVRELR